MTTFNDAALRAIIDLRDAYEATMDIWRDLDQHEGRMAWKVRGDRSYLYHLHGDLGNGRSLGPRSPETEAIYAKFRTRKSEIKASLAATTPDLKHAAAVYVALGLPVLDSWTAKLVQHLDRAQLLGETVLIIGTNAMPAYQIEAQQRAGQRMHATRDLDIAWAPSSAPQEMLLWNALRKFEPEFTINQERPFQARTRARRELELLTAPSVISSASHEPFQTLPLPEQEWLLMGERLRQVVTGMDRTPTAIAVPDPRFFALHKAWLADKPGRDPLKRPKDRSQARLLWSWLHGDMPRYPLDAAFRAGLPALLVPMAEQLDASLQPSGQS